MVWYMHVILLELSLLEYILKEKGLWVINSSSLCASKDVFISNLTRDQIPLDFWKYSPIVLLYSVSWIAWYQSHLISLSIIFCSLSGNFNIFSIIFWKFTTMCLYFSFILLSTLWTFSIWGLRCIFSSEILIISLFIFMLSVIYLRNFFRVILELLNLSSMSLTFSFTFLISLSFALCSGRIS